MIAIMEHNMYIKLKVTFVHFSLIFPITKKTPKLVTKTSQKIR